MLILCKIDRVGNPFKIQWAPKWNPESTKWRQIVKTMHEFFWVWRFLFATSSFKALQATPLRILDRCWYSFGFLLDRFRTPFYLISFSVELVLNRRFRQSWVMRKWVGGAPEGITIRRPLLAGDRTSQNHCKL